MDIFRFAFGAFIFFKGLEFANGTQMLVELIQPENPSTATLFLAHYVAMAHLAGGILVFIGLISRLALLVQLPIFIGAVIININNNVDVFILAQSLLALIFCLVFIIYGSGRHSVDHHLKMHI